ncbi:hypothetical protein Metbo_1393 [Methanobacterium lacus]|uniref:Uncharacterized protein n=1 Tax=Methanobacterium lacus (strain AL-21) TaxID=877455 RepID=F0T807_METLA|nr:hypothetical protein [Methanobacterium lacus]ADZ09633.1 hypothetical protein Metbo_1393 [Methanobacterium lacus]
MIKISQNKYKIPDEYRRKILSGYFSIALIILGTILIPRFYVFMNLNFQIILTLITLIPGAILWIYFFNGFIRNLVDLIKSSGSMKNETTLKTHYFLIWIINIIWIVLAHFIYNISLSGILIPIISIILLIKFMR